MTLLQPPSVTQGGCTTARQDRLMWASLICDEGVDRDDSMTVTHSTPDMSVVVGPGAAWILGNDLIGQGFYHVYNDADVTLTIAAADPTDDRIDLVVVTVHDSEYTGSTDLGEIHVVTGVSSPAPVAPSVPLDSIVLATVRIAAGTTGAGVTVDYTGRAYMKLCQDVLSVLDREVYLAHARIDVRGGGHRVSSAAGVSWDQRFIVMCGRDPRFAPAGFFDILMPANGTVIPVHGYPSATSVTVTGGLIPLPDSWCTLWYDLPLGSGSTSQSNRFHITQYQSNFVVPDSWVEVVGGYNAIDNFDLWKWGDGQIVSDWVPLSMTMEANWTLDAAWVRYLNGRRGYNFNSFHYTGTIVSTGGNITNMTVASFDNPAHAPDSAGYAVLVTSSTGGMGAFYASPTSITLNAVPAGTNYTNPAFSLLGVEI